MSGVIFTRQDNLIVRLTYTTSPGTIASGRIRYRKPGGEIGYWPAVVDQVEKTFTYTFPRGEFLQVPGTWTFWSWATLDDGRVHPGSAVTCEVSREGSA